MRHDRMKNIPQITVDEVQADCTGFSGNPDAMVKSKIVRTIDWKLIVRVTRGNKLTHVFADPCKRWNLLTSPKRSAMSLKFQSRVSEGSLRTDSYSPRI